MSNGLNEIKTQATVRKDGRVTITIKLIGWNPSRLASIGDTMNFNGSLLPEARARIGRAIYNAAINAYIDSN